ncbi:MAG: GNAT family N-acetyltransferase [Candidatus Ranarchaeia archaeon]
MTKPNFVLEQLTEIPEDAYDVFTQLIPIDLKPDSKRAQEYRDQFNENISSGKRTGFVIRKPKNPIGFAWYDVVNKIARVRIELGGKYKQYDARAHLATLEELKKRKVGRSITGTLTFDQETNFREIITNFEKVDTIAQVRVDMERIADRENQLEKPPKFPKGYSLKKWKGKYLEEAGALDYQCFLGTPDAQVLPELETPIAHVQFFREYNRDNLGRKIQPASFILFHGKTMIGVLLTIQVNFYTAIILTVDVHPDFRNQGLATLMVHHALYVLQKARVRRVVITVTPTNEPAFKLAQHFEYKPITQRIDYCYQSDKPVVKSK